MATAMHFQANARLIFLTDELTNDRYLVNIIATLSIIPSASNANPSGPLLKGASGLPIPSDDSSLKLKFLLPLFASSCCWPHSRH
jgi:hypothetical protein